MHPVELKIPGQYWDSLLYKGLLFLFQRDGSIRTIDWDALTHSLQEKEGSNLAVECAFRKGSYLYGTQWELLFSELEVRELIRRKFLALSGKSVEIGRKRVESYTKAVQENQFSFPHNDSHIYYDRLYVGSDEGIETASCGKKTVKPVSQKMTTLTDCPALAFSPKYRTLAIAAGEEGLFDLSIRWNFGGDPRQLSSEPAVACEWLFYNVLGLSGQDLVIAEFESAGDSERKMKTLLSADQIFERKGFSWGNQDKLCQLHRNSLSIKRYNPYTKESSQHVQMLGHSRVDVSASSVVSAAVAAFGIIIELHDSVTVLLSDGSQESYSGEPVNWRIFPRAVDYSNQLHLIYDDHLSVLSFNQDYFENQGSKLFGLYRGGRKARAWQRQPYVHDDFEEIDVPDSEEFGF